MSIIVGIVLIVLGAAGYSRAYFESGFIFTEQEAVYIYGMHIGIGDIHELYERIKKTHITQLCRARLEDSGQVIVLNKRYTHTFYLEDDRLKYVHPRKPVKVVDEMGIYRFICSMMEANQIIDDLAWEMGTVDEMVRLRNYERVRSWGIFYQLSLAILISGLLSLIGGMVVSFIGSGMHL